MLVLGIDGGTEGARAGVFDTTGKCLGMNAQSYRTDSPRPGFAEQNPADWWQAFGEASRSAVQAASCSPSDIKGMCIGTTTCTVVALDANGAPLRPAMLWMDVRAERQAQVVAAKDDPALRVNGNSEGHVSPEWMIPKAMWLKENEPRTYADAATICEYQDYMNWRLAGRKCASHINMAVRWHYQAGDGGLPHSLLQALNLAELPGKWPADIVAAGEQIGELNAEAAEHLGLRQGLPLFQGGPDACMGALGLGATEPGTMVLVTGSAHVLIMLCDRAHHHRSFWGTYAHCPLPNCFMLESGQTSSGSTVNWFVSNFCVGTSLDELNAQAGHIRPGCEGLLALDYFQGNRFPHADPLARGAVTGLSLAHSKAHVYRALLEGICLGTRAIVDELPSDLRPRRLVVTGGATNSDLWMRIHADTLGQVLERTSNPMGCLLGCAMLAQAGVGGHDSIQQACLHMRPQAVAVQPDAANREIYDEIFGRYRELYPALRRFNQAG